MIIWNFIIFILTLIFYLHIYNHVYVSNTLDIQYIPSYNKQAIDNLVDLKEPFFISLHELNLKSNLALSVKEDNNQNNLLCLPDVKENFDKCGHFLKPYCKYYSEYDYMIEKKNASIPLQYSLNVRNFFYITSGSIKIKLIPPKWSNYLLYDKDYIHKKYTSSINVWNPTKKDKKILNDIQTLTLTLSKGYALYIPPYWNYSFKTKSENNCICILKYKTPFNILANAHHYVLGFLQEKHQSESKKYTKNKPDQ